MLTPIQSRMVYAIGILGAAASLVWVLAAPAEGAESPGFDIEAKHIYWDYLANKGDLEELNGPYTEPRLTISALVTTPPAQVAPVPAGSSYVEGEHAPESKVSVDIGVEQWRSLVAAYFPAERVEEALAVMSCESRGNPNAANPRSSADGLFQHLDAFRDRNAWRIGLDWYDKFDPVLNTQVTALVVAADGGWRQWSCQP